MDNFLNGFLKAWRSWRNDGREAFMRAFLQEVQHSKPNDSEHFFTLLKQEMQAVSAARSAADQQDILAISNYIDTLKEEMAQELTELQQHTPDNKLDEPQVETQEQELGQVPESNAQEYGEVEQNIESLEQQELQQGTATQEAVTEQLSKSEQELVITNEALDAYHTLVQKLQEQQRVIQAMSQELTELQQHTQDNVPDEPQVEVAKQELEQTPESLEEQELLQSLGIFQDEIQEVLTEHPNGLEQELETSETKNLVEQSPESNLRAVSQPEQLDKPEQGLEVTNKTPEPQQTPPQATDIENKYAKLHSYFKQVELDVQQKRIKTKSDFKESFLNYAKSHMTEDELKVLLVLSQKQPSKLTQEHRNLINDALEQAHGNKHMQDRGLQLSVKAVLGYPLETEHYTTIQSYVQQCQASLEPMDGKVAGAMHQYLAKMQRSRETPTESQANQQEASQAKATAEQSLDSTPPTTDRYPNQVQTNDQAQTTPATLNSVAQQEAEQKPRVHLGSASYTAPNELDQQAQAHHQAQPALNNMPIPELWIESQNSSKPWLETQTQDAQVSHTQTAQQEVPKPWLDAPAKPRGRRR